jgi:hypothetical protein
MVDVLINAFKFDEFLLAMAGQFVNEGSAKLTLTAVKALGLAIVGFAIEAREGTAPPGAKAVRRRKKKPPRTVAKNRKSATRKGRSAAPSRSGKARSHGTTGRIRMPPRRPTV